MCFISGKGFLCLNIAPGGRLSGLEIYWTLSRFSWASVGWNYVQLGTQVLWTRHLFVRGGHHFFCNLGASNTIFAARVQYTVSPHTQQFIWFYKIGNLEVLVQPFNRVRHANLQSVVSRPDSRSLISSFLTISSGISSFYMPCSFQFLVLQMPRISQREFECPYWTLPCTQVIPEARKYSLDKNKLSGMSLIDIR